MKGVVEQVRSLGGRQVSIQFSTILEGPLIEVLVNPTSELAQVVMPLVGSTLDLEVTYRHSKPVLVTVIVNGRAYPVDDAFKQFEDSVYSDLIVVVWTRYMRRNEADRWNLANDLKVPESLPKELIDSEVRKLIATDVYALWKLWGLLSRYTEAPKATKEWVSVDG